MRAIPAGGLTDMVAAYMTEQTGATFAPGTYSAMAIVDDNDDFVGGVVFSNFRGTDCEISCAAEPHAGIWRPHIMRAVFTYVFQQLGCVRCTSVTTKANQRARDFLEGLGFELEGKLRLGYDGRRDALIYGLLARDCRYLAADSGMTDGQEISAASTSSTGPGGDGGGAVAAEQGCGDSAGEPEPDRPVHPARVFDVLSGWN